MHTTTIKKYLLIIFSLIIAGGTVLSEKNISDELLEKNNRPLKELEKIEKPDFYQIRDAFSVQWEGLPDEMKRGWKQFKRWEYFWESRVFPNGTIPDGGEILKEVTEFKKNELMLYEKNGDQPLAAKDLEWKLLGPVNTPDVTPSVRHQGIGRVNVIRFHPANFNELWAGAASGGVWKSTDGGSTWSVFPYTNFLSLGVSDIAIAKTNPNIVYVATGDAVGSLSVTSPYYSIGLLKTTNGGAAWETTGLSYDFESGNQITRILVHPQNENIVLAATAKGIYRTTDGGKFWDQVSPGGYFKDMEFHPGDPNYVYASTFSYTGGTAIYRSSDNGRNWELMKQFSDVIRIALAVTRKNSNYVYALCSIINTKSFHSVQISTDMGKTWQKVTDNSTPNLLGRYKGTGGDAQTGQGWYDLCLAVHPNNTNTIHTGGINIWKSGNFGYSWDMNAHWIGYYGKPYVHADIHDMEYQNNSTKLFAAHDGGIDYTTNGGSSWHFISDGMSITQFYSVDISQSGDDYIIAGSQDNGTSRYQNGKWTHVGAGDGMMCAIDPSNPRYCYSSNPYGSFYLSTNFGKDFDGPIISVYQVQENSAWVTPIAIDPNDGRTIYVGFQNIYKSTNRGDSWKKTTNLNGTAFRYIKVAPSDSKTIYACTLSDLYVTYDGGDTWKKIQTAAAGISSIEVDPNNNKRVWITYSGFDPNHKVVRYDDENPVNLSGNMPNIPVNTIVYQKNSPDRLYIGTDVGVYYSDYGSGWWESYGAALPNVIVSELKIQENSEKLIAGTYGRGVWEIPLLDCNLPQPEVEVIGETEFCRGDSVIIRAMGDYENYFWSTGETSKEIIVKKEGVYSLIVEDESGCNAKSRGVAVEVLSVPDLKISTSGEGWLCEGEELTLSVNFGFTKYEWSNGGDSRSIKITEPGKYTVTAFTADNCKAYDEITVEQKEKPEKPPLWQKQGSLLETVKAAGYRWYYDGKRIFGADERTYEIDKLGNYTVEIFNEWGCSEMSNPYNVVSSVDEISLKALPFKIYPNPSEGVFNITPLNHLTGELRITVKDMLGRQILEKRVSSGAETRLDLSGKPDGAYLVILSSGTDIFYAKIMKK